MKTEIKPSGDTDQLVSNLDDRFKRAEKDGDKVKVELEKPEKLELVPGIEEYSDEEGSEREGLGGNPVDEQAYARIDTREQVARAFLATVEGYDLVVLDSSRDWDLRLLRRYNPGIKNLRNGEPRDELDIQKAVGDIEGMEPVGIEIGKEEAESVYRFLQP